MITPEWHRRIFIFGLITLAGGMLFGAVPTSVPQGILVANWLLEKNYSWKWQQLKNNKIFWLLSLFFLYHVVGLLYTENITRGLEDIKTKLPLLVLPIILFSTKPLSKNEYYLVLKFFIVGVFISSICCYVVYLGYTNKQIVDIRQASVFISHIRFSIIIAFAIFSLMYLSAVEKNNATRFVSFGIIIWLLFFMYKLEMATGIMCLLISATILLIYFVYKKINKAVSIIVTVVIVGVSIYSIKIMQDEMTIFAPIKTNSANVLLDKTASGRNYFQDTLFGLAENGNLIAININEEELSREWERRSSILFSDIDNKGNSLRYTLIRYMASKGLRKDSTGVVSLTQDDIINIENGNTNYKYNNSSGLIVRWRELVWEYISYKRGENPSGHTLTMRLEFWKTGLYVAKQNLFFGVGTGDVQTEYNNAYEKTNTKLTKEWRLRCHNQYLAILVAFGVIGLLFFMVFLSFPAFLLKQNLHVLFYPFLLLMLLSFITEDTLETQTGASFFAAWYTLFLWLASFKEERRC